MSILFLSGAQSWNPEGAFSRRQLFKTTTALPFIAVPLAVQATELKCPQGSNNCVEGSWTPPAGASKADAVASLKSVLDSYPQQGQADVDGGGWKYAIEDSSNLRLEFSSSGKVLI